MWVIVAFGILPLLGLIFAVLHFSGEDSRRADGRTRLMIFAGRSAAVLAFLACLGLLWIARGSLREFHVAMAVVGVVLVLSIQHVFHRASELIRQILAATGFAMVVGAMALGRFDDGGWIGLARGAGWAALLIAAGVVVGSALRHFDKNRERKDAGLRSLKDSTRS